MKRAASWGLQQGETFLSWKDVLSKMRLWPGITGDAWGRASRRTVQTLGYLQCRQMPAPHLPIASVSWWRRTWSGGIESVMAFPMPEYPAAGDLSLRVTCSSWEFVMQSYMQSSMKKTVSLGKRGCRCALVTSEYLMMQGFNVSSVHSTHV